MIHYVNILIIPNVANGSLDNYEIITWSKLIDYFESNAGDTLPLGVQYALPWSWQKDFVSIMLVSECDHGY